MYFKKQKSEALDKFKKFKATAEKESGIKIKAVRTDRGGEYMSEEFVSYLKQCGIQAKTTAAYSPQQNGVAERLNRTIGEAARSMLLQAGLSKSFWAEAVATATFEERNGNHSSENWMYTLPIAVWKLRI